MQEIHTLQAEVKANRERNQALAKECSLVAQGFLLEAQRQGFADKHPLKQASHYFLKALELHHRQIEAYLGLAFLSALVNQYDKAQQLLAQAKAINPEDARIGPLEHEITRLIEIGVDPRTQARAMMARLKQKREAAKAEREVPLSKVGSLRSHYEDEEALMARLKKRREQGDVVLSSIESVQVLFAAPEAETDDFEEIDEVQAESEDSLPLQPEDLAEFAIIEFDGEDD